MGNHELGAWHKGILHNLVPNLVSIFVMFKLHSYLSVLRNHTLS